jgi:hypothetical protein
MVTSNESDERHWSDDPTVARDPGPTDYADMGTAFGLDATVTLDPGLAPQPSADAVPPWEHRLTRRNGL